MKQQVSLFAALLLLCSGAWAGDITGTVRFEGTPPKMRPIDMRADPVCCTTKDGKGALFATQAAEAAEQFFEDVRKHFKLGAQKNQQRVFEPPPIETDLPIKITNLQFSATVGRNWSKLAPLPTPPAMSTIFRPSPKPSRAATVAPGFVPLESLI